MSSPYRTLGHDELRGVLADRNFATPAAGVEFFELGITRYPVLWAGGSARPAPVRGPGGVREVVTSVLNSQSSALRWWREARAEIAGPGERCGAGGGLEFGMGGQLRLRLAGPTPRAAADEVERTVGVLSGVLAQRGVQLVGLGQSPWHGPDELSAAAEPPVEPSGTLDAICSEASLGATVARSAGTCVRIGFGGPLQRTIRWRVAEVVAPVATGMFACSPLGWNGDFGSAGGHHGFKSQRARARLSVDPTRMGFARPLSDGIAGDPVEAWVELGLGARIAGLREGHAWIPPRYPFSFGEWMEHGLEGRYPDVEDWREHIATLDTEVYPDAAIEIRCVDALPGPFQSVPLTFFTALLCDSTAAHAVLERLDRGQRGGDGPGSLRATWTTAARAGLSDLDLAEQARWLYGRAAEALLRLPEGWFSKEQLAAFVAFGRRYTLRGLTPADEVLDLFLERGGLGPRELELLDRRFRGLTGRAQAAA